MTGVFVSLKFDGVHVVSGSLDTSIRVWDVETGNCIHTLTGHQSLTSGMELKDNILVSGNADSTVKIWDIKTGQCLQTLQGERGREAAPPASCSPACPLSPSAPVALIPLNLILCHGTATYRLHNVFTVVSLLHVDA